MRLLARGAPFVCSSESRSRHKAENVFIAVCYACRGMALWVHEKLIWPSDSIAPMPSDDMPDDVRVDFMEARQILEASPRAASAMLRLCVESLCIRLKAKGSALDEMIAYLVSQGLPVRVQEALDSVRVIGNSAIHAGLIDAGDQKDTAILLFNIVNYIVDRMISDEKGSRLSTTKSRNQKKPPLRVEIRSIEKERADEVYCIGNPRTVAAPEMQAVIDAWLVHYNTERPHQGRGMNGRTPAAAFREGVPKPAATPKPRERRSADQSQTAA